MANLSYPPSAITSLSDHSWERFSVFKNPCAPTWIIQDNHPISRSLTLIIPAESLLLCKITYSQIPGGHYSAYHSVLRSSFYRWQNWSFERLINLPKFTQLVKDRVRPKIQLCLTPKLVHTISKLCSPIPTPSFPLTTTVVNATGCLPDNPLPFFNGDFPLILVY